MLKGSIIKVLIHTHDRQGNVSGQKAVDAKLIEERPTTVLVELPGGRLVVRKKSRDLEHAQ